MHGIPNCFEFEGLLCFAKQSARDFYYFAPLHADLDRDVNGRPMFSLIAIGASGYLMCTAVWKVANEVLETLRSEIAIRNAISDPSTIKLAFAPVQVARCDLLAGDGSGALQAIATSATSGVPPYSALFSVNLSEEQFAWAVAAVNGRAGFLAVEYEASLTTPVKAHGRFVPRSAKFIPWLREYLSVGRAGVRAAIETAIDDGLAAIEVSMPDDPTGRLFSVLYDRVLSRATDVLPEFIETWDEDTCAKLEVAVTVVEEVSQPFCPHVDLSSPDIDLGHITVAGNPTEVVERIASPPLEMSSSLSVRLGFNLDDAPLAWIRLRRGDSEAMLKPPYFASIELPASRGAQPVTVTVGYTNGVHNHKTVIDSPSGSELVLMPQDLGLQRLSVDARPLAESGADSAHIWLRYRPPHGRAEQRHSIPFRDHVWVSNWWLVTLARSSLRYLDYKWTAIAADGRLVSQSAMHADSFDIVLSFAGGTADVAN